MDSDQFGPMDVVAIAELVESAAPEFERITGEMIAAQERLIESLDRDRAYWRNQALGEQWGNAAWGFVPGVVLATLVLVLWGVV